jgi:hypothetical protein
MKSSLSRQEGHGIFFSAMIAFNCATFNFEKSVFESIFVGSLGVS